MRIRTIKPEFWVSESIGRISREARLLFIGLWSFADDSGRGRGALPAISGALFPYDGDAHEKVSVWFAELEREGMVVRYKSEDGNTYYEIPKWLSHQKIEKPSKSKFPAFTEMSVKCRGVVGEMSPLEQGTGNRDQGSGNRDSACSAPVESGTNKHSAISATKPDSGTPSIASALPHFSDFCDFDGHQQQAVNQNAANGKPGGFPETRQPNPDAPDGAAAKRRSFQKPTEEECRFYGDKIGLPKFEVEKFMAFYESKGWKVGREPMKSWQSAMSGWKMRWEEKGRPGVGSVVNGAPAANGIAATTLGQEIAFPRKLSLVEARAKAKDDPASLTDDERMMIIRAGYMIPGGYKNDREMKAAAAYSA